MALSNGWVYFCVVFLLAFGCLSVRGVTFTFDAFTFTFTQTAVKDYWDVTYKAAAVQEGTYHACFGGNVGYWYITPFQAGTSPKIFSVSNIHIPSTDGSVIYWKSTGDMQVVPISFVWNTDTKRISVKKPGNSTAYPIVVRLIQDGNVIETLMVPPGASPSIQVMTVPTGSQVTVQYQINGVSYMNGTTALSDFTPVPGGTWIEDPNAVTRLPAPSTVITPVTVPQGGNDPAPVELPPVTGVPSTIGTGAGGADTGGGKGPIWSPQGGATNTANTDLLTNATYREGVNKLFEQQEKRENREAKFQDDREFDAKVQRDDIAAANTVAGMQTETAKGEFLSTMPIPSEKTAANFTVHSAAPNFTLSMMGHSIDADPFKAERFGPIASWFKTALAWVVMGWFAVWLVGETRAIITGMAATQQAKGAVVTVLGNGTSAITALVVAGVITTAFGVAVTAIVVYFTKDLGAGSVMSWVSGNPYAGAPGAVAYCLDKVFPLGVIAACLVGRVVFGIGLQTIFGVFVTVVRFCLS